jgi:hypothetical protein
MKTTRYAAALLAVIFLALATGVSAQWSPGGTIVYMGDLNLVASSLNAAKAEKAPDVSAEAIAAANNTTQNGTSSNNNSINAVSTESPATVSLGTKTAGLEKSSGRPILDLSQYANDRTKNNLAGYTNIMYPITGSRGTTTSTSAGSGACGSCGG